MHKFQQKGHFKQGDFYQTSLKNFSTEHNLVFPEIKNTRTNSGGKNLEEVYSTFLNDDEGNFSDY